MAYSILKQAQTGGFALLMALIVVSAVVSVGVAVVDLTVKQLRLTTTSKDSETAFHAANAGMECIRYHRNSAPTQTSFETGASVTIDCFGVSSGMVDPVIIDTDVFRYDFSFSWSAGDSTNRCSTARVMTINTPTSLGAPITILNPTMRANLPGYPVSSDPKVCPVGGRCTVVSVQGYNRSCGAAISQVGTIQREVLLEF